MNFTQGSRQLTVTEAIQKGDGDIGPLPRLSLGPFGITGNDFHLGLSFPLWHGRQTTEGHFQRPLGSEDLEIEFCRLGLWMPREL